MKLKLSFATVFAILAAVLVPLSMAAQTNVAYSGVTLAVAQSATATYTSSAIKLPTFTANGTLTVVEAGITGSPSGCTIKLYYSTNASGNTSVISTSSFTPSTGTQTFAIAPSIANGDNVYLIYACSSTYPTAGTFTAITLSPSNGTVNISGAPTVNLTAVAGTTLGAVANYGTSPGAVAVPGVNAYVTNTPAVTGSGTFTVSQINTAGTTDPCANPSLIKSSAAINVSSATTTQIVALSGTTKIYVCEADVNAVGTSPSVKFITGTGTACATPDQTLTGAMVPSATVGTVHFGYGGSMWTSNAGDELCLVSAGGTVTTETGFVTYVQQ